MCFQKRHRLNNVKYTIHRLSEAQIRATVAFDILWPSWTRQASACVAVVGPEWWSGYHVAPSMANWLNWGRFLGTPILASRRQEQTDSDTVHRLHSKNVDSHGERVRRRRCWNARCFGRAKDASPAGKAPAQMFGEACRPGKFSDARAPFGARKTVWDSCVTVIEFSKLWLKRKIQLLGHIIRSDPQDPMHQVLFLPNSLIPRTEHARRVGRPRAHWLIETYADAYRRESGHIDQFDINNILQRNLVNKLARQRLNIFSWHSIAHLFTESFITESFVTESSHHRKLRQRKFGHRKRAYSRPGLRNKRCLHTPFAPFASVPPPLVW